MRRLLKMERCSGAHGAHGSTSDVSDLMTDAFGSEESRSSGWEEQADKHWACDVCANVNFENEAQLHTHVQSKHPGLCQQYREMASAVNEKLMPVWDQVLAGQAERWERWGEKTFHVACQRDGGPEKINEAHAARAQLEVIVQRWNPEAKVFVFGSSVVMGVWDGMSDIDYMVANVHDMEKGAWPPNEKNAVRALTELLKRAGFKYNNLEPVQHARVPIIKHHASVPLFNAIPSEAEDIIARTVRWIFTQPLTFHERVQFEAGLRDAVSEVATVGGQCPIVQLWWHSEHHSCSATFVTTTHAVKAIVHTPCIPAPLLRRVGPLHDDFQPELFKIDFDLGFRPFGVRNSFLLRNYLNSHPCARPGAIVLKDWSKSSGINNSIGGYYTSYAVNIMWIYYLVQKGVIPHIDPSSIPQSLVDCHDYNPRYVPIIPPEIETDLSKRSALFREMGELLVGFFAFYCFEFNWDEHVVTLNRSGDITAKADLQWVDTPVVQGKKSTRYLQCIEDPYEDNLNLGRHVGDARRWKVLQEFYRALLSLTKDPFHGSCVFTITDQASGTAGVSAQEIKNPTTEDLLLLTGLAVQCVEGSSDGYVTESALRAHLTTQTSAKGSQALETALRAWSWDQFVRKIGYKQISGRVYARRLIGARAAKAMTIEESKGNAMDLSEQLVRQSASNALDSASTRPPEWVLWTPPTYALPNAASRGPFYVPGYREPCSATRGMKVPSFTAVAAQVLRRVL